MISFCNLCGEYHEIYVQCSGSLNQLDYKEIHWRVYDKEALLKIKEQLEDPSIDFPYVHSIAMELVDYLLTQGPEFDKVDIQSIKTDRKEG